MRYLFLIIIVFFSCNNDKDLPAGIIAEEKMELLVWDLLKADEIISLKYQADSSINRSDSSFLLYQTIFQIHKVSEEDFKRSFVFYRTHPELLKPILDSLQHRSTFPPQLRKLKKVELQ